MTRTLTFLALLLAVGAPLSAQVDTSNLLRPGDQVVLRVWPDTTLSGVFPVEPDGQAYFPRIGSMRVVGRPVEQVRRDLTTRLGEYLTDPIVLLTPRFRVSLLGAVRGPGLHWVDPSMTLFDLIVQTGGLADDAKPSDIRMLRGGEVLSVDMKAALEEAANTAAVPLQSGDRIVVPQKSGFSFFSAVRFLVQVTTLTLTIVNLSR